eukprot:6471858-Amphidinium_carterae.1
MEPQVEALLQGVSGYVYYQNACISVIDMIRNQPWPRAHPGPHCCYNEDWETATNDPANSLCVHIALSLRSLLSAVVCKLNNKKHGTTCLPYACIHEATKADHTQFVVLVFACPVTAVAQLVVLW